MRVLYSYLVGFLLSVLQLFLWSIPNKGSILRWILSASVLKGLLKTANNGFGMVSSSLIFINIKWKTCLGLRLFPLIHSASLLLQRIPDNKCCGAIFQEMRRQRILKVLYTLYTECMYTLYTECMWSQSFASFPGCMELYSQFQIAFSKFSVVSML